MFKPAEARNRTEEVDIVVNMVLQVTIGSWIDIGGREEMLMKVLSTQIRG
jgi:hypothetical protein